MSIELAVVLVVIIAGFIGLFLMLRKRAMKPGENQPLLMLQNQMNELTRVLDSKILESTKLVQAQSSQMAQNMQRIIGDVTRELVKVTEGQKQIVGVTEQLRSVQDILKNPKQRGVLGEHLLEITLRNVLPPGAYQMQYQFRDGDTVDAAVFFRGKTLPIDSKFSLENYNRMAETRDPGERERLEKAFLQDIKNRIDETAKYIKPKLATTEVAFMYVPGEAIYSDLVENRIGGSTTLIEYAVRKGVVIVSPAVLIAYLQTVLQGIREQQLQDSVKEIVKWMEEFRRHIASYENHMQKLGAHLGTAVNTYNTAYKELGKVDKDVLRITGKSAEIEPLALARPNGGEEE